MPPQSPVRDTPAQRQQEQRAIVQRMIDAGESEENIATVIRHFEKTPEAPVDPTGGRSVASRVAGGLLTGTGIAGIPGFVGDALTTNPLTTGANLVKGTLAPLLRLGNVKEAYQRGTQHGAGPAGFFSGGVLGGIESAANEVAAAVPIFGPAAESASKRWQSGDVAGGMAETAGVIASPVFEPFRLLKSGFTNTARLTGIGPGLAKTAERMSESRMVQTIAPKRGQNKTRFGNTAADVAPRLAREEGMGAATLNTLADKSAAKLAEVEMALDASNDARLSGHAYDTAPIIADLKKRRQELMAEAVQGSHPTRTAVDRLSSIVDEHGKPITMTDYVSRPLGKDVIPPHGEARIAELDKAIKAIEDLGPVARYDAIRTIRQSFDGPAKAIYSPSMTADYMLKRGEKLGAADVTGVLRDHLAKFDPETAKINPDYNFWRKVDDVLNATEETERVTPHVGRTTLTRGAGAVAGASSGGLGHVLAGLLVAEGADRFVSSGITTKILMSRELAKMADAMRKGKPQTAQGALARFARYAGLSSRLAGLLQEQKDRKGKEPE